MRDVSVTVKTRNQLELVFIVFSGLNLSLHLGLDEYARISCDFFFNSFFMVSNKEQVNEKMYKQRFLQQILQ